MRKTLTEQVRESIRREYVLNGVPPSGGLPAENMLASRYHVSIITIRRAVEELVQEGFLVKKQGKGTFVVDRRSPRSYSVGLVIPENRSSPFYTIMGTMIEPLLRRLGHQVHLFVARDAATVLEHLRSGATSVDGLLICGYIIRHQLLRRRRIPYVLAGSEDRWDADCVSFDLKAGAFKAVSYLIEQGHRRILFMSNYHPDDEVVKSLKNVFHFASTPRYAGYCEALAESGLDPAEQPLLHTGDTKREAYRKMKELLSRSASPDFSAVFASTDLIAEGAIQAIRESGLDIPGRISIIGCDNLRDDKEQLLPLTTLDLRLEDVAVRAIDLLLERIRQPDMEESRCFALTPRLILRETVSPCPGKS